MERRKLLDAEITNKTGAAKIAALKTRADLVLKDIDFLNSLSKTKSERIKATADWLKANGASATKLETKAKNFATMVQKYASEGFNKSEVRPIIEKLMTMGVPALLTMSSAEAFNIALQKANLKTEKSKVVVEDGGTKPSSTVGEASDAAKTKKMFGK